MPNACGGSYGGSGPLRCCLNEARSVEWPNVMPGNFVHVARRAKHAMSRQIE